MIGSAEILKASILIVDDQDANVSLLERTLRGAGYVSVTSTTDPHKVCELHRKNRYSLILLDLEMPGMDGFEVLEGLKSIEANGYLPVLAQTAHPNHKLRALKAGAKDFVSKPFDLAEVLMRVHNMLEVRLLHLETAMRTEQAEKSEQAISASELSYRRLFEAAKDGILILEADTGRISDVNPFLAKLLGFSHGDLVGTPIWELGPFGDILSNKAKFEELQQQGYVRYDDLPLETRDGRKIAVEFVSNVYPAGVRNVIQCNIRDNTEHNRIAHELKTSEERFRTMVEQSLVGIYVIQDGKFVYLNPKMEQIFGVPSDVLRSLPVYDFVTPEDRELVRVNIDKRLQGLVPSIRYELRILHGDGDVRYVEVHGTRIEHGGKPAIMGSMLDTTERKRAELAALRLAAIVEFSDDAIIGKDLNGIITSWNRGAEKVFGYAASEMVGTSIVRLIPADRQDEEVQILGKIRSGESVEHFETLRQTKDGRLINISVTASPIKDATGKAIGVSKVARDITERKEAEEKILQMNSDLEQRVAERTSQLQTANADLEAFTYSVSHDLRAPLRHVMGFVNLLQKDAGPSLSAISVHHLATITRAAKRMGNLIEDLLSFSRIGKAEIQKTEVNLDELVQETLADFQMETKERHIAWEIRPLPPVRADRALLRLALVNLISNAVKFTGNRAQARIEIGFAPSGDGETLIFIRDNGAGFDPRYAQKLFGVFQRLHSQEEFEGTGIGLANVQRIIHRHGGQIWAEGVVDGGATFYFSIPKTKECIHGH